MAREAKPFTRIRVVRVQRIRHRCGAYRDPMTFLRAIPCPAVSPRRSFLAKMGALAKEDAQCGPQFYSMKITEDVGKYAAEQKLSEDEAARAGLEQKAKEFVDRGAEVDSKA
jgi:hypothetical protein